MAGAEATLRRLVDRYDPAVAVLARAARASLRKQLPPAYEMIYDDALVIGYAPAEKTRSAVMSIALYPRWVNLFFLFGATLPDPDRLLQGSGTQVRSLRLADKTTIDSPPVRALIAAAVARAPVPFGAADKHTLQIRALSEKLRPRRPVPLPRAARKAPR